MNFVAERVTRSDKQVVQKGFFEQLNDFGPDEGFMLFFSAMICVVGLKQFAARAAVWKLGSPRGHRVPLYVAMGIGFALLYFATRLWAAKEVRENGAYVLLTMVMGGACLTITGALIPWLGIGLRDDAFERRNFAAVLAWSGAVLGVMLIYTGANLGEGPSFWSNMFCSVLGVGTWLALWLGLELGAGVSKSVAEERDVASGLRLAGFLVAEGLVLGRALAGNWHSVSATVSDFANTGWPGLCIMSAAIIMEMFARPSVACPFPSWKSRGLPFVGFYLAVALGWLWHLGWWEGANR